MARVVHHIKRQEANAREIILKRHRDYESFKDLVLREWNKSGSGFLDHDEVAQWMDDMKDVNIDVMNRRPEKCEIEYIIMEGNRDRLVNQGMPITYRTLEQKIIAPEQFGRAADAWLEYQASVLQIEAIFNKFDEDGDKLLNKQELQAFLTDLNELQPVSDEDVDQVIQASDILGHGYIVPINLPKAIAAWLSESILLLLDNTLVRSSETLKNATDTINTGRYALDKKKQQDQQSKACCVS